VSLALLLSLAAAASPAPPAPKPDDAPREPIVEAPGDLEGWHFAGIPLVAFASDVGLTLGAAVFFYRPIEDHPEARKMATLGFSYATRGPRSGDLTLGTQRLLGTPLQTSLNLHLGDDDRMPYWGEGARLGGLPTPAGFGTPPEPYRYHDRRAFAAWTLRAPLVGHLGAHLRARYLNVDVAEASALLLSSRPPGQRGGRVALAEVGVLYDTRDRELGTRSGVFASAAVFVAPQVGGVSDFAFHGYDGSVRVYVPLWAGAALAARALYDRKIAGLPGGRADPAVDAVPFFERTQYEGIAFNEGLGGYGTVRGIARYRLAGDEKLLGNLQLRVNVLTSHLAGKTQEWGLGAGVDAGWARQPGFEAVDAVGAAAGLRFIWDRTILLRIEMGRARGGDDTLYVAFGEMF
jgi:hypothetical protein